MKDRQGIARGKCTAPQCECSEYMAPQDSSSARCEYCDHVPVKHVKIIKLGACMKCKECDNYETEEPGSYSNCGYCECPAQNHHGAEKLFKPAPTQASVGPPTMPNTSGAPVSGSPSVPAGQCKVPGCTKPCYAEKGRIYEFCGRTHADHYSKLMMQQGPHPTPTATKAPPSNQQSMITNAPGPMSQEMPKVCENCRANPPNKGYKLCQRCYINKT